MLKKFFSIAAVAMLFAACEIVEVDVEPVPGPGSGMFTVGASFENNLTKSDISGTGVFTWSTGDAINVRSDLNRWNILTIMEQPGQSLGPKFSNANFTTSSFVGSCVSQAAVFPQTVDARIDNETLYIKLPKEIVWNESSLEGLTESTMQADNIMVARFEDGANNLAFKNVGGLFRLTLNNIPVNACKLVFSANQKISGEFAVSTVQENHIDYPVINTSDSYTEGENQVTIKFATVTTEAAKKVFFIPVPVGTYHIGFAVKDANDNVLWEFNSNADNYVARAHMKKMPTLSKITIGGGGEGATNIIVTPTGYSGDVILPNTTSDIQVQMNETAGTISLVYSSADGAQHPANVYLQALGDIAGLNINLPDSHVELTGNGNTVQIITEVTASTTINTFVVDNKVQIGKKENNVPVGGLTISGGSLELSAPVVGPVTVVYDRVAETVNKTADKVSININSAIDDLVVTSASTQSAPDKIYVTLGASSKVNETLSVPETNCNLYIAPGAQAKTVNTSAEVNTIEGTVETINAATSSADEDAPAPTVTVTSEATVSTAISATGGATVFVDENAKGEGTLAINQSKDEQSSINSVPSDAVAVIGNKSYSTLAEAFAESDDDDIVTLLKDINETSTMYAGDNRFNHWIKNSITIEGNDHTITVKGRGIGVQGASSNIDVIFKNVTITNVGNANGRCVDTRGNIASLSFINSTLTTAESSYTRYLQPLTIGGNQSSVASVTITNSNIIVVENAKKGYAVTTFNPVNMNITGSTIKGWACLNIKGADSSAGSNGSVFNVTGSTLISANGTPGDSNSYAAIKIEDDNVSVNITNTAINVNGEDNIQRIASCLNLSDEFVTDCNINLDEGNNVTLEGQYTFASIGEESTFAISGGTFNVDPSAYLAPGYEAVQNGNVWNVVPLTAATATAQVGSTYYATLDSAFSAAQNGQTVVLLKSIDLPATINVAKQVTLDLNSKKLSNTADLWAGGNWSFFSVKAGGNLTVTGNGTIDAKANDCYTFDVQNGGVLTIKNGTFTGNISCVYLINKAGTGVSTCNIEGGHFSIKQLDNSDPYHLLLNSLDADYTAGLTNFVVTGGSFEHFNPAASTSEPGSPVSFVPDGYYATEENDTWTVLEETNVAQIGGTKYATLAAAIAAAEAGQNVTIKMLNNCTIEGNAGVTIPTNKSITLDLNGKTICNLVNEDKASQVLQNNGTLTITDSSAGAIGVIMNSAAPGTHVGEWWGTPQYNYTTNVINNCGVLNVYAGTLNNTASGSICYAVDNNSTSRDAIFNLYGGLLTAARTAVRQFCNSTVNKNDVNIYNGSIEAGGSAAMWTQLPGSDATKKMLAKLNIEGGQISAQNKAWYDYSYGNSFESVEYSISGGVFNGIIESNAVATGVKPGFITGGTFSVDPSAYVAAGYGVTKSGSNYVVAQVNTTWDGSSKAALTDLGNNTYGIYSAAQLAQLAYDVNANANNYAGKTVKLMNNIDLNNKAWTPIGNVTSQRSPVGNGFLGTFDGNGKTISNLSVTAHNGEYSYAGFFGSINPQGQTVTIQNLTIDHFTISSYHFAGAILGETGHDSVTGKVAIKNCYVSNGSITTTPWDKGNGVYDDGNQAGGLIGSAYNYTYEITGNTVDSVNIKGYRALGGIAGFMTSATFTGNTVKDCIITQSYVNSYSIASSWKLDTIDEFVGQRGSGEDNYKTAWSIDGSNKATNVEKKTEIEVGGQDIQGGISTNPPIPWD